MTEEEFKIQMALLAKDDPKGIDNIKQVRNLMNSHSPWERNQVAMHLHARYERPRHFLRWSTIQMTMFVGNAPYIEDEWKVLMRAVCCGNYPSQRWRGRRLDCPYFGRPVRSNLDRKTTGDFIRHAHTLNEFEQKSQIPTEQFGSIFEFGGGYGALCYLIYKLGFMGKYQLYDLPEMELLQRFYLGNTIGGGIDTEWMEKKNVNGGDWLTTGQWKTDLFIANISLSETPISVRDSFLGLIDAKHYYITYLPTHDNVANHKCFNEHREKTVDRIDWIDWINPYKKNIRYLYGRKL